jgi:hypothetical protein
VATRNVVTLSAWLNRLNPDLRKLFHEMTGFPARTLAETRKSIFALNPSGYAGMVESRRREREASHADAIERGRRRQIDRARARPTKVGGVVISYGDLVDCQIRNGFTVLEENPRRGAAKTWALRSLKTGSFYVVRRRDEMLAIAEAMASEAKQ